MTTEKDKSKEQLELDKVRKGKKADDCSIFVEDMIISGEGKGNVRLSKELEKERKKRSKKK